MRTHRSADVSHNAPSTTARAARRRSSRRRSLRAALRLERLEARQLMVADITGTVFIDTNANGVDDAGEPGLAGWTVYLDANGDHRRTAGETFTVTDAKGKYAMLGVAAGNTNVAVEMQAGVQPLRVGGDYQSLNVRDGRETRVKFPMVNSTVTTGSLSGTVYDDTNLNGSLDADERGIAGINVFVDLNRDGVLSTGEPIVATAANGNYQFGGLPAGSLNVFEIPSGGYYPTSTSVFPLQDTSLSRTVTIVAGANTQADFPNSILQIGTLRGNAWNDDNGDGVHGLTETGLAGQTVYLDLNLNGTLDATEPARVTDATGSYAFSNLRAGIYQVNELLPTGMVNAVDHPNSITASLVGDGQTIVDFYNLTPRAGSISGKLWNDQDGNGLQAVTEAALSGWQVYLDANNNGLMDSGETSVMTAAGGTYQFTGVAYGNVTTRVAMQPNWIGTQPTAAAQSFVLLNGQDRTGVQFGVRERVGNIQGTIWNDDNGDRVRGATESGLAGWNVFLDLNSDGLRGSTEPSVVTDVNGAYVFQRVPVGTYRVVEEMQTGWITAIGKPSSVNLTVGIGSSVTADFYNLIPQLGSISGVVFSDVDSNGSRSADELGLAGWTVYIDANANNALDPSESFAVSDLLGQYQLTGVSYGNHTVRQINQAGYTPTTFASGATSFLQLNGEQHSGLSFGNHEATEYSISGNVFFDANHDGSRTAGELGLSGVGVYLDINNNGGLDAGEPTTSSSSDLYYTPGINEAGNYSFTHLARGTYTVRELVPDSLSATSLAARVQTVTVGPASASAVDFANIYRANEIHGVVYEDNDGDGQFDAGEQGRSGVEIYIDSNRNNSWDDSEQRSITGDDGSYAFTGLVPGAYIVRELPNALGPKTYPTTGGGILWPAGTSNPAQGLVAPSSIKTALLEGQSYQQSVSLTLPDTAISNMVDVFLLFDDTGSFTTNSPIVRSAFPSIISSLQTSLTGVDLGFGVGRFEEYGNFAAEYSSGRPFVLNQPIINATTPGFATSIQAALDRTAPGYGGDQPETDIEALYQLVTGAGFDGNHNGTTSDSGAAGLASTQLNPGVSGDVPAFASFTADPANNILPASGNVGGAGFRAGALPVVLLATDTGFAYQPKGETSIEGVGGLSLPLSSLTQLSRPSTPFSSGAGIQETVTGLNALGALVIGLGTNAEAIIDPRQQLESLAKLTGATNRTDTTIANGTADPIAPGDPFYFLIQSGFGATVADGIVQAVQNAVTNVSMDITVQSSDPRVHIINHSGTQLGIGKGQTANFDLEFVGDGRPRRFDLQFVRSGTNVILGSIPVELGVPVDGEGYSYDELEDGEIHHSSHFGHRVANSSPVAGDDQFTVVEGNELLIAAPGVLANDIDAENATLTAVPVSPPLHGQLTLNADGSFQYLSTLGYSGLDSFTYRASDGVNSSSLATVTIQVDPRNHAPVAVSDSYSTSEDSPLTVSLAGVLTNDQDIDGDALTARLVTTTTNGTLSFAQTGQFVYTPNANFNGTESFSYLVNDGTVDSGLATVTIQVAAVNDAPVAQGEAFSTNEDTPITITRAAILANDTDVEGSSLTPVVVTGPARGTLTTNATGAFVYTPSLNFSGLDSFTYRVSDGLLQSNLVTAAITVLPVNDAPLTAGESYNANFEQTLSIAAPGLLGNDTDIDRDALTAALLNSPLHGVAVVNANGSFSYTPATGYSGPDSFTYRAVDPAGLSATATVSINVSPSPTNAVKFFVVDEDQKSMYRYSATGTPLAGNPLNKADSKPRGVASNVDGTIQWVIDGGGTVYVYSAAGALLGQWTPLNVGKPEGITVWNNNLWLVDPASDRVYAFTGGAALRSGKVNPTSSFALNAANGDASDLVTDGSRIWVLNDTLTADSVFRYSVSGALQGSWTLGAGNPSPRGITLDPTAVNHLWIVDSSTDRVHQYDAATSRVSGTQTATSTFALSAANTNPQGIADPRSLTTTTVVTTTKSKTAAPSQATAKATTTAAPAIVKASVLPATPAAAKRADDRTNVNEDRLTKNGHRANEVERVAAHDLVLTKRAEDATGKHLGNDDASKPTKARKKPEDKATGGVTVASVDDFFSGFGR